METPNSCLRLVRDLGFVHCQPVLALAAVSLCQRVKGMLVLILAANETAKLTWLKKTGLSGYLFLLEETLHFCRLGRDGCVVQKSSLDPNIFNKHKTPSCSSSEEWEMDLHLYSAFLLYQLLKAL